MSNYRLDRTAFKAQNAEEATKTQAAYYKTLTWQERLRIANYLNSVAYNYPEKETENQLGSPRLDKALTITSFILTGWIISVLQILFFAFFKQNPIDYQGWKIGFFLIAVACIIMVRYIYMTKARYQYIISFNYSEFTLNKTLSNSIIFLTFVVSIAMPIGIGVFIGNF